ncbi:MAG: hypothetical protein ABFD50_20985 [Smithella sp.]
MPRDLEVTFSMYSEVKRIFDVKIKEMGCSHRIDKIYKATAESPAPCFFMTSNEAMSIVSHHEAGRCRRRSRDLTRMRDNAFLDAYLAIKKEHPEKEKRELVEKAIMSNAPRFYINWRMVAFIISRRNCKKYSNGNI